MNVGAIVGDKKIYGMFVHMTLFEISSILQLELGLRRNPCKFCNTCNVIIGYLKGSLSNSFVVSTVNAILTTSGKSVHVL